MENRIKLRVKGITNSQVHLNAYTLVLAEEGGTRRLPIVVGIPEAQAIAMALEHIKPPRPLTHDLMCTFAQVFNIHLEEVFIYKCVDGVYYAELRFEAPHKVVSIDSRTSDAIALAIRVGCPIYTTPEVIREYSILLDSPSMEESDDGELSDEELMSMEPQEIEDKDLLQRWLSLLQKEELKERLATAIQKEDYESAQLYQNEITRRANNCI